MTRPPKEAYIDEFGDSSLETLKDGVSTHFIVTAVIADPTDRRGIESQLRETRDKYFPRGEIRSATVGQSDRRRLQILVELVRPRYFICSLVVDKREIESEGLRYKPTFQKFMHSLLYRQLFPTFPSLRVYADEHGSREFMDGFAQYVSETYPSTADDQYELDFQTYLPKLKHPAKRFMFGFVDSKSSLLVQLADFIAGTLGRCFDEKKRSPRARDFMNVLGNKISYIKQWPKDMPSYTTEVLAEQADEYAPIIAELSCSLAKQFIKDNERSNHPIVQDQVACVELLLFQFRYIDAGKYIPGVELIKQLSLGAAQERDERHLHSNVIAKLRDQRIPICSTRRGYKLAATMHDLHDLVDHKNGIIQPMLMRLRYLREQYLLKTGNKLDILDQRKYEHLRDAISTLAGHDA